MPRARCKQVRQMIAAGGAVSTSDPTRESTSSATLGCVQAAWLPIEATETLTQREPLQHTKSPASSALCDTRAKHMSEVPRVPAAVPSRLQSLRHISPAPQLLQRQEPRSALMAPPLLCFCPSCKSQDSFHIFCVAISYKRVMLLLKRTETRHFPPQCRTVTVSRVITAPQRA